MALTNVSSARKAGFKLTNRGIGKNAAIAMSKFGTRTLYYSFSPAGLYLTGAGVVESADGIFAVVTIPDANAGSLAVSFRLPGEFSAANVTVTIYWKCAVTTGNAKFSVELGSKANGESTASSGTTTVTTAAKTTANKLNKSQAAFASALFAVGDWIGIKITRDPADAADTLGANLKIVQISMEFTGQG